MPAAIGVGARPVADLVPVVTSVREQLVGQLVLVGLVVTGRHRQLATAHADGHLGALLDGEGIGRQVVGRQRDGRLQRGAPLVQALPGRAVDEVEAHRETGRAGGGQGT